MSVNKLLNSPEGKILEFKRVITGFKQIMKTIVALVVSRQDITTNTAGGGIVIGREDNDDITGTAKNQQTQKLVSVLF